MTCECYYGKCPHHSNNHGDEGPFCHEPKCLATVAQTIDYQLDRAASLDPVSAAADERRKASLFEGLMKLCGHWRNASDETVKFYQDDACRTYHVVVGKKEYYGDSFEEALNQAIAELQHD